MPSTIQMLQPSPGSWLAPESVNGVLEWAITYDPRDVPVYPQANVFADIYDTTICTKPRIEWVWGIGLGKGGRPSILEPPLYSFGSGWTGRAELRGKFNILPSMVMIPDPVYSERSDVVLEFRRSDPLRPGSAVLISVYYYPGRSPVLLQEFWVGIGDESDWYKPRDGETVRWSGRPPAPFDKMASSFQVTSRKDNERSATYRVVGITSGLDAATRDGKLALGSTISNGLVRGYRTAPPTLKEWVADPANGGNGP